MNLEPLLHAVETGGRSLGPWTHHLQNVAQASCTLCEQQIQCYQSKTPRSEYLPSTPANINTKMFPLRSRLCFTCQQPQRANMYVCVYIFYTHIHTWQPPSESSPPSDKRPHPILGTTLERHWVATAPLFLASTKLILGGGVVTLAPGYPSVGNPACLVANPPLSSGVLFPSKTRKSLNPAQHPLPGKGT